MISKFTFFHVIGHYHEPRSPVIPWVNLPEQIYFSVTESITFPRLENDALCIHCRNNDYIIHAFEIATDLRNLTVEPH